MCFFVFLVKAKVFEGKSRKLQGLMVFISTCFFFLVKIEALRDSKTGANLVVFFNRGGISNMEKL